MNARPLISPRGTVPQKRESLEQLRALEAGMQLQSNFTPAGFGAYLNVNLSTSVELKMQLANDPDKVEWIASWGGLVGKAAFTVFYITPDNAIEISKQKNFINGRDTGWMTMFEFPN